VQSDEGQNADETSAERERQVELALEELRRAFHTDPDPAEVRHQLAVLRGEGEAVVDLTGGVAVVDLTDDPPPAEGRASDDGPEPRA
jgi:hypothetical protein